MLLKMSRNDKIKSNLIKHLIHILLFLLGIKHYFDVKNPRSWFECLSKTSKRTMNSQVLKLHQVLLSTPCPYKELSALLM